jgi:ADP-ribose pyrophosphatase YjhB (NUDIX family)
MRDFLLELSLPLVPADSAAALIILEDRRYLMQARDQKPGIFYPDHWGLFGGAMAPGEDPATALRRELHEELDLDYAEARFVTTFSFDFRRYGRVWRHFFEIAVPAPAVSSLTVREGRAMQAFSANEILNLPRVVPYDSFAIFLHATRL